MRVLHISSSGRLLGGAEHSLIELVRFELENDVAPMVVVPNKGELRDELMGMGVPVVCIPYYPWREAADERLLSRLVKRLVKVTVNAIAELLLVRIARGWRPDVVHINTSATGLGSGVSRRIMGFPLVWHVREISGRDSGRVFWSPSKQIARIRSAQRVVCVSESAARAVIGGVAFPNVSVVYDDVPVRSLTRRSRPILVQRINVGIVGPIMPAKGQMEALEALVSLRRAGHNINLSVVGAVGDAEYHRSVVDFAEAQGVGDVIRFLGECEDVPGLLGGLDMIFVCSRSEAFGRVTVEAMYAGCLVIGRNNSCTAELLSGGNGLLYDGGGAGLAEATHYALSNVQSSRTRASKGHEYAVRQYGGEKGRETLLDELRKVALT